MGKVEIYNRALTLLGLEPISSINEDNKRARSVNLVYDMVLRELLIEEPWNFATKRVNLARLTSSTQTRCTYEYQYPSDCLKIIKVYTGVDTYNDQYIKQYEVIGDRICSNYDSLQLEYVHVPANETLFFAGFGEVLAYKLAITTCYKLIKSNSREQSLVSMFENVVLPKAISLDAQQEDPLKEVDYLTEVGANANATNVGGR